MTSASRIILCIGMMTLSGLFGLTPAPIDTAHAEWYVAGYGGISAPQSLKNVAMDAYGLTQDRAQFSGAFDNPPSGSVTQSFHTSNINLKQSPLFGGKAGYFFADEGLRWLGVEIEAFTSTPTIKRQTLSTTHDVTFLPNSPDFTAFCTPGVTCQIQRRFNGTLALQENSLQLITLALNVVARYPGEVFQPYVGVGVGGFYFKGSDQFNGRQIVPGLNLQAGVKILVTEEWGFFVEGKYNRATLTNFDPGFGLSAEYSAFNAVAGLAFHF
ncbi:MAG: hypothetical protein CAF44_009120 [Nitrospira sp. CG24D]|nr:MAG: hypothetical protein CAF44_009120 [Nitrospira sp. CG24D]